MSRHKADKSPEQIKFLLSCKKLTFADVDRSFKLPASTARKTARYPHYEGEKAIASALGLPPSKVWPSRYDSKTKQRLKPQPAKNYKPSPRFVKCQKRDAA